VEARALRAIALAASGFGGLTFADFGGANFVGGGVAGAFEGAPHVPAGDGAVRAPAFAERQEFRGLGHVLFAIGDGPAFFDAEIVDGEDVGTAETEDQEHFDGPGADAADGDQALDEFFVCEFLGFFETGDDAFDGFLCEILHGKDFRAGEASFAERRLAQLQHFFGRGCAACRAEGFDAAEDGGGSFAGDGLVGDGFEEDFVRRLRVGDVYLEWESFCDQAFQAFVAFGEECRGFFEVKGEDGG
jgi:hypothetical protein